MWNRFIKMNVSGLVNLRQMLQGTDASETDPERGQITQAKQTRALGIALIDQRVSLIYTKAIPKARVCFACGKLLVTWANTVFMYQGRTKSGRGGGFQN